MLKTIFFMIIHPLLGKKILQPFFEFIHILSINGMLGSGAKVESSGEINLLKKINKELLNENNLIVFDVGANIGKYSIAASEIIGNKAKIYSFEPSKKTFEKFIQNTADRINIFPQNLGIGSATEQKILYTDRDGSGLASIFNRTSDENHNFLQNQEFVQLTSIDEFASQNNIGHVHLLKIDSEGNEINGLLGAKKMIEENKIDYIQFEFGGCNIDSKTYLRDFFYLLNDKYTIHRILRDGLRKIEKYDPTLEIFVTSNFIAINKNKKSL